ncbi:hypothetical protein RUND412_008544 [Rhizina undulata]
MHEPNNKIRVAVIGSGLAGLTTAYLLNGDGQQRYEVEVFEMAETPSLDAASVTVADSHGRSERLDVPMRGFAGGFYKQVFALYNHLGVSYQQHSFLFSFSRTEGPVVEGRMRRQNVPDAKEEEAYYIHSSNYHRLPPLKPMGRSWLSYALESIFLWFCYNWFTFCCYFFPPRTTPASKRSESLREYLERIRLSSHFIRNYLLPLISAVTTCSHESLLDFPASDVAGYKRAMNREPHYLVTGGINNVQNKLLEGIKIGLNRRVFEIEPVDGGKGGIVVRWQDNKNERLHEKLFDRVVLGVNPVVVGKIYKTLWKQMSKIPCCETEVWVHTDGSFLEGAFPPSSYLSRTENHDDEKAPLMSPRSSLDACLTVVNRFLGNTSSSMIQLRTSNRATGNKNNIVTTSSGVSSCVPSSLTEATHVHSPGVLITTTPLFPIKSDNILGGSRFTRVLRSCESRDVVARLFGQGNGNGGGEGEWNNGDEGVSLVGGWCWDGMVLLEGCVRSAVRVARDFDVEIPWETSK